MTEGFGVDTWCLDSTEPGRFARGRDVVVQAIYRRLTTPRGTLRGGPGAELYGYDVSGLVGRVGDTRLLAALPAVLRAEILRDDRIADVTARVSVTDIGAKRQAVTISLDVVPHGEDTPFRLTIVVDSGGVTLGEIPI